jgi:hypothetical protein
MPPTPPHSIGSPRPLRPSGIVFFAAASRRTASLKADAQRGAGFVDDAAPAFSVHGLRHGIGATRSMAPALMAMGAQLRLGRTCSVASADPPMLNKILESRFWRIVLGAILLCSVVVGAYFAYRAENAVIEATGKGIITIVIQVVVLKLLPVAISVLLTVFELVFVIAFFLNKRFEAVSALTDRDTALYFIVMLLHHSSLSQLPF